MVSPTHCHSPPPRGKPGLSTPPRINTKLIEENWDDMIEFWLDWRSSLNQRLTT